MNKVVFLKSFLCAIILVGLLSGCAGSRQLKMHRETLDQLAYGNFTPQEKLDVLGKQIVILMDEALSKLTALGTYKHVKRFTDQNQTELELIYNDLYEWQANMSDLQKVGFGASLATKSYTRRFITLLPKFKKKASNKYKQLVFFSKLMNLFNPFKKNE